ncbi:hypothetical protein MKY34_09745 [Sporosarcina sp. FSL K6-1522]|uniref:hypothetical protein n=1 Tax=Sporosarcina sp. FSL K6-1522 TaxID=2921554 RepID=UPI00315ADE52
MDAAQRPPELQQLQEQLRQLEQQLHAHQQQLQETTPLQQPAQQAPQSESQQQPAQQAPQSESQQQSQQIAQSEPQQQARQPESQQANTDKQLPHYFTLPKIVSTVDIGYLQEMLSSNLRAVKQYRQAAQDCQLPDLKQQFTEIGQMHLAHYNNLLQFLAKNGGEAQ